MSKARLLKRLTILLIATLILSGFKVQTERSTGGEERLEESAEDLQAITKENFERIRHYLPSPEFVKETTDLTEDDFTTDMYLGVFSSFRDGSPDPDAVLLGSEVRFDKETEAVLVHSYLWKDGFQSVYGWEPDESKYLVSTSGISQEGGSYVINNPEIYAHGEKIRYEYISSGVKGESVWVKAIWAYNLDPSIDVHENDDVYYFYFEPDPECLLRYRLVRMEIDSGAIGADEIGKTTNQDCYHSAYYFRAEEDGYYEFIRDQKEGSDQDIYWDVFVIEQLSEDIPERMLHQAYEPVLSKYNPSGTIRLKVGQHVVCRCSLNDFGADEAPDDTATFTIRKLII